MGEWCYGARQNSGLVSSKISDQEEIFVIVVENAQGSVNDMSLENVQCPPRQVMD